MTRRLLVAVEEAVELVHDGCIGAHRHADTRGMDVDELLAGTETEQDRVVRWRELQLLEWFAPDRAFTIAKLLTVDLHELRRLVGLGATPEQAATIAEAELP